ncbi:MAG: ABC transporter permease subunit [Ignavibacteriae bacterium]|nr:ABC transporter permease subunit [Ignavibacteriota bacterium]
MKILVLILYTFRELLSRATLVVLAGISTLVIALTMLSISMSESSEGVTLQMFGNPISPPLPADAVGEFVRTSQVGLSKGLFIGIIFLGVFATAGIVPATLRKGTIDLYLSKPLGRWELLLGKCLGAIAVMFVNVLYFIGAIWLTYGVKVGVWNSGFLFSSFSITFVFACLYSLIAFLAVLSRGSPIPIIGAFLYLFVIGGLLESREQVLYLISENTLYRSLIDGLYYVMPQISAMQAGITNQIMETSINWKPFVQSILSAGLFFGVGVAVLSRRDF